MRKQNGALTEWLGSGLQNRPQQFESAGHLIKKAMMKRFSSSLLFYKSPRNYISIKQIISYTSKQEDKLHQKYYFSNKFEILPFKSRFSKSSLLNSNSSTIFALFISISCFFLLSKFICPVLIEYNCAKS